MRFTYLVKELTRRKTRAFTNILAVAILIAILIVLTSLMNAYSTAIYLPFKNVGADLIIQESSTKTISTPLNSIQLPFGKGIFPRSEIDNISKLPEVKNVSKSLTLWQYDNGKFTSIEGVDLSSFTGERLSSWITSGRFLNAEDEDSVVVEKHFAKFYGYKVGNSIDIGNNSFDIVGIVTAEGESQVSATNIFMNLVDAQQLLNIDGYNQVYVQLDSLSSEDSVRSAISQIDTNASVISGNTIAASLSNAVKIYNNFRVLGIVILALIVAFILFQVSATGLIERRKEIGIMQTVGWSGRNIRTQIISEIFLQTVAGCIIGIVISIGILALVGSLSIQTGLPGDISNSLSTVSVPLVTSVITIAQFSALALVLSALVSILLVRKLFGIKPAVNLKNT